MKALPIRSNIQPHVLQIGSDSQGLLPEFVEHTPHLLTLDQSDAVPSGLWTSRLDELLANLHIDVVVFNDWVFGDLIEPLSAHVPIVMICNSYQPLSEYFAVAAKYSKYLTAIVGVSGLITSTLRDRLPEEHKYLVHEIRNGVQVPSQKKRFEAS